MELQKTFQADSMLVIQCIVFMLMYTDSLNRFFLQECHFVDDPMLGEVAFSFPRDVPADR